MEDLLDVHYKLLNILSPSKLKTLEVKRTDDGYEIRMSISSSKRYPMVAMGDEEEKTLSVSVSFAFLMTSKISDKIRVSLNEPKVNVHITVNTYEEAPANVCELFYEGTIFEGEVSGYKMRIERKSCEAPRYKYDVIIEDIPAETLGVNGSVSFTIDRDALDDKLVKKYCKEILSNLEDMLFTSLRLIETNRINDILFSIPVKEGESAYKIIKDDVSALVSKTIDMLVDERKTHTLLGETIAIT